VIEDLDILVRDFRERMSAAVRDYLTVDDAGGADEKLESVIYGRFLDVQSRKAFFDAFKHLEVLWEILSPSPELRDHIANYQRLTKLYAAVRQAYAEKVGFIADLAYKTRRLIEGQAEQQQLSRISRVVTFDAATIESLKRDSGSDEGKVFNLVRGLHRAIGDEPEVAPILLPLKERAERILKDLEDRKTSGLAAMDLLAAMAAEKDAAMTTADASGLSRRAFAVAWKLREDKALQDAGISADDLARETDTLLVRFPNAAVNVDEKRRLRAALYRPLLKVAASDRARIVDGVIDTLFPE
jgi:type I restriction enzyme R subunit